MSTTQTIDCWSVSLCAGVWILLVPFAFAKLLSRSMELVFVGSFLSLAVLFPVGVLVELFHRRLRVPRRVSLCLVLTALVLAVLVKGYSAGSGYRL